MKISVVIPMFNAERTISVPLGSLLSQVLPAGDFELILVDDGSTDRSAVVAGSFLERASFRWSLLRGPRRGVSAARNRGIEAAQGEHVYFLDADDSLPPDFLAAVLDGVERKRADMAWTWKIKNPGEFPALVRHPMNGHLTGMGCLEAFLREPKNGQVMVRKSFLDSSGIRYTEGLAYGEDFDFFVRLLAGASLVHVEDRTFYLYRKHPLQVTRTIDRLEARQATDGTMRRLAAYLSSREVPGPIKLEMNRHIAMARINLLREAKKRAPDGVFEVLLQAPESLDAIRFAGQGLLPVKWQVKAAMLDLARMMKA